MPSNKTHFSHHERAAELHDLASHAHLVAEQHGQEGHADGHELSRQALEHSSAAHQQTQIATAGHGIPTFGHADIAKLAHQLWQERGCLEGAADADWFQAAEQLRANAHVHGNKRAL